MPEILWNIGDLFVYEDSLAPRAKSYGVVTSLDCVLVIDTGLRANRYRIVSGPSIPNTAVPLAPTERKNIPFEIQMALEAIGVTIGVPNFCLRC
ncbi:MAG: hypothetical protein LiPW15_646 [Parcubacteria group bacterium LiPW_15]|nr:MAG: hypothetical protein LiPW15_646 [Parcubacteria group bacterium LiPW_15]